jgi:hypothetical protein
MINKANSERQILYVFLSYGYSRPPQDDMIVKQGLFGRGPVGRDRERGEGDGGGII